MNQEIKTLFVFENISNLQTLAEHLKSDYNPYNLDERFKIECANKRIAIVAITIDHYFDSDRDSSFSYFVISCRWEDEENMNKDDREWGRVDDRDNDE